jgi:cell division septation protein DedD
VELTVLTTGEAAAGGASLRAGGAAQPPTPAQMLDELVQALGSSSASAADSASASGVFTIEVAESSNARHARAMVDELKGAGHAAYLETVVPGGSGPYRVRVGRYSSLADAKQSARTLERALGWQVSVTAVASGPVARGNAAGYGR